MAKVLPKEIITVTRYVRDFSKADTSGFWFDCDEKGNLLPMSPEAKANYDRVMKQDPSKWEHFNEIKKFTTTYVEPARLVCNCGKTVYLNRLYYGATDCECGQWWNAFGQEILPPPEWQEYYWGSIKNLLVVCHRLLYIL